MRIFLAIIAALLLPGIRPEAPRPAIDHHQHLLSPSAAALGSLPTTFTVRELIPLLDAAGVQTGADSVVGVSVPGSMGGQEGTIPQVGVKRILWGSDGAFGGGMTPQQALKAFQKLPFSNASCDHL